MLTKKDIRTSNTGEHGADVRLLTHTAKKLFPYSVETKNVKSYKLLYGAFKQAQRQEEQREVEKLDDKKE